MLVSPPKVCKLAAALGSLAPGCLVWLQACSNFTKGLYFTKVTLAGQTGSSLRGSKNGEVQRKEIKPEGKAHSSNDMAFVLQESYGTFRQSQRKKRKVVSSPVSGLAPLKKSKKQMTKAHWGSFLRMWFGFHFKVMLTPKVAVPSCLFITPQSRLQAHTSTPRLPLTSVRCTGFGCCTTPT